MSGDSIFDQEEVMLTNKKFVEIIYREFEDIENRRISKATITDIIKTLWLSVITELISGNRVITPIGTFSPKIKRLYGSVNYAALGVRKSHRPLYNKRIDIGFSASEALLKTMKYLIERYDAQQTTRNGYSPRKRRLVRITRQRKCPPDETVGR